MQISLSKFYWDILNKAFSNCWVICAGLPISSRRMMSSFRLVPPVVAMTFTPPMCLLMLIQFWLTCRANSRVGTSTMAREQEKVLIPCIMLQHNSNLLSVNLCDKFLIFKWCIHVVSKYNYVCLKFAPLAYHKHTHI